MVLGMSLKLFFIHDWLWECSCHKINKPKRGILSYSFASIAHTFIIESASGILIRPFLFTYVRIPIVKKETSYFNDLTEKCRSDCSIGAGAIFQPGCTHYAYSLTALIGLPKVFSIGGLVCLFFPDDSENTEDYHWVSWRSISNPTSKEGLG